MIQVLMVLVRNYNCTRWLNSLAGKNQFRKGITLLFPSGVIIYLEKTTGGVFQFFQ